jgi:hypothetical protein
MRPNLRTVKIGERNTPAEMQLQFGGNWQSSSFSKSKACWQRVPARFNWDQDNWDQDANFQAISLPTPARQVCSSRSGRRR